MCDYKPQFAVYYDGGGCITESTDIITEIYIIKKAIRKLTTKSNLKNDGFKYVRFVKEMPSDVRRRIAGELNTQYVPNDEGYAIDVNNGAVNIYSLTERGLFYGCLTLLRLSDKRYIKNLFAYEYPVCFRRGIKIYLPAKEDIGYFKKLIDMICHYKYNTVMIEVGGAMEYKKHPEINQGWEEYCRDINEYSGKANKIQEHTFDWKKNSIHAENGGGSFLSQDTVRHLVEYCKESMLDVIPEMPSLSHCDYLLLKHPEICERKDDPYPDTYCPSNPESYELLFDVLKEVIDVFKPSVINIGHDEYYSIGICDKCRDKAPEKIYADDITKIHDFLDSYGIRTMIWSDKLLNAYSEGYGPCGGARRDMISPVTGEYAGVVPATYPSIDLVPKDLLVLHWYWSLNKNYENEFLNRNMDVTYGNFSPVQFPDWKNRVKKGIKGAIISNWSALKEENLQRNGVLFAVVYGFYMFWNPAFDDNDYENTKDRTFKELYRYKYKDILDKETDNGIKIKAIEFMHTTDLKMDYKEFVDGEFIDMDRYKIGHYTIGYEDGTEFEIPIVYGTNISNVNPVWERKAGRDTYEYDRSLIEASFTALPVIKDGITYYKFTAVNPYPDKMITAVKLNKICKYNCDISLKEIKFIGGA